MAQGQSRKNREELPVGGTRVHHAGLDGLTWLSLVKYRGETARLQARRCSTFQEDRPDAGRLRTACPLCVPLSSWPEAWGVEVGRYEWSQPLPSGPEIGLSLVLGHPLPAFKGLQGVMMRQSLKIPSKLRIL